MIAVMTDDHTFAAMVSERHVAVRTLNCLPTRATKYEARITTPVQEYDRLLATLARFANAFKQFIGKHSRLAVSRKDVAHVNDLRFGHRPRADALGQRHEVILAFTRVVKRFERRRC